MANDKLLNNKKVTEKTTTFLKKFQTASIPENEAQSKILRHHSRKCLGC